jgi:starch-binding outer membrane protein, SusD/RagB family
MPKVADVEGTGLSTEKMLDMVLHERRVETAFEGIRYYDILRWCIAAEQLNGQYTGMKLTNDPASYTTYPVDAEGYFIMRNKRAFVKGVNELWPIPQSERDINKNLTQNTGY